MLFFRKIMLVFILIRKSEYFGVWQNCALTIFFALICNIICLCIN